MNVLIIGAGSIGIRHANILKDMVQRKESLSLTDGQMLRHAETQAGSDAKRNPILYPIDQQLLFHICTRGNESLHWHLLKKSAET